ncbi:MAG: cytochrome c-type biogenesis protein [Burkholderiaceae bacterium]
MAGPMKVDVDLPPLSVEQKARLKQLEEELRCLVCQNQNLADSNAELASDLRNIVHRMVAEGRGDQAIKDYLVERYGDFVLYDPPVQSNTWLLWGGPFAMLALGAGIWATIQRRQRLGNRPDGPPVDDAARARARALLDEPDTGGGSGRPR